MKNKIVPVIVAVVVAVVALIALIISNNLEDSKPSRKHASEEEIDRLFKLYDGIGSDEDNQEGTGTRAAENQVAIVLNSTIVNDRALDESGRIYLSIGFIKNYINNKFYWDNNENILIYTTPADIIKVDVGSSDYYVTKLKNSVDYTIVKTEGQNVYVALDFVKMFTNLDYSYYKEPNRVCVTTCYNQERKIATVPASKKIRLKDSIKSDIVKDSEEDMKVVVVEEEGKWSKVVSEDGFVGYIKTGDLSDVTAETLTSDFIEPEYTSISKDFKISLAWHLVETEAENAQLVDLVTSAKGLNVVSPTWFRLEDNEGNISSKASADYVEKAHLVGLEVWAMVDDQSPNSKDNQVFNYTSKRERIINQLIASAIENNIDGINIDFEYITGDIAEDYIQFMRELSVKCRINGIVLSVDVKTVDESNLYYNHAELGEIVDYVIMMGYDEHWGEGSGAGSVASLPWVEDGIKKLVEYAPANKVINAVPFYTRIWTEDTTGKFIDSQAVGMQVALNDLTQNGVQPVWVENVGQNYGEYESNGHVVRIWLEDASSLEAKLSLINKYSLAGVAAWRLGLETPEIWNTMIKYTN